MSAHEWTRARQRSVRREGQPIPAAGQPAPGPEPEPITPEAPPAAPVEQAPPPFELYVAEEPATMEGVADEAPVATEGRGEPEPLAPLVQPAPAPPVPRRPPRRRQVRPTARQVELPLGLEPTPEAPTPRSATETREELIERLLDPHLSLQETAKVLDVCPTTVRRYTNRGLLAHYRTPGNQRRFRLSDVLAFMERQGIPAQGLERKRAGFWEENEGDDDRQ